MTSKYSITCHGMNEKDVALIKSLVGIIAKGQWAEWVYSDGAPADVVIVDADNKANLKSLAVKPRVVVTYTSPDATLVPNTVALYKPARARDLIEVLESVRGRLEA